MGKNSFLDKKADYIRREVIKVSTSGGAGHIAPSLSSVDVLVALYYGCMNYKSDNPLWEDRDRLVLSKGHGCYGLYAILADKGILPRKEWDNFYTDKSSLSGCVERRPEFGLEASCGALGHGLPMAVGLAYGAYLQNKNYYTFCVVGDGEMQEGSIWEGLQFAAKHELSNLIIIVDRNRLQAMDFITNILDREKRDIVKRLRGFGFNPRVCPGHDIGQLIKHIQAVRKARLKVPGIIIAETIKGYGLKCMENVAKFHFRLPTQEELSEGRAYE